MRVQGARSSLAVSCVNAGALVPGSTANRVLPTTTSKQVARIVPDLARMEGREWPAMAHTMIGWQRLLNLQSCVEQILAENVPGDLIETGVWRGGAIIFGDLIFKLSRA